MNLRPGMYVRIPVEERPDNEFREFQIGQLIGIDPVSELITVALFIPGPDGKLLMHEQRCPVQHVQRSLILADTPFIHTASRKRGRVLVASTGKLQDYKLAQYYVLLDGHTTELSEAEIAVAANRQDPDPWDQLHNYELHNPIWRAERDKVVESYAQLRNATYGLEDLVGSRVLLLAHQAEVIARVLGDTTCRYLLADEVGLGKTIEAAVILKALRRRHPMMRTLIVVPQSLAQQWHNELDNKFWMDFPIITSPDDLALVPSSAASARGAIVTVEALASGDELWQLLVAQRWGLLIADEAHHLRKHPTLYERILTLSSNSRRALILSATPIQRRATEYLALLRILDPRRYGSTTEEEFNEILAAQDKLRNTVAYLAPTLTPDYFDQDEFTEEFETVVDALDGDPEVSRLAGQVVLQAQERDQGLRAAREAIAYVSENYRVERRVIRNRRASLQIEMPERKLNTEFAYDPGPEESGTLATLYEYLQALHSQLSSAPHFAEYCRILLHAAASSPHALLVLLHIRSQHLAAGQLHTQRHDIDLTAPGDPRSEPQRVEMVLRALPSFPEERATLDLLAWRTTNWVDAANSAIDQACANRLVRALNVHHRLVQTLRAIHHIIDNSRTAKVVVFSSWIPTLEVLHRALVRSYGRDIVAQFHSNVDLASLQTAADLFQSSPACAVLLCDELGGEGRNFQIAHSIVHVDLPWTPAQIEQRIGRVDRLGRTGIVYSIVPFAKDTIENDLFRIWNEAFELFTASMSGMEIALEGVQNELTGALSSDPIHGLATLLPSMTQQAAKIKQDVKDERYFEEGAINHARRAEFAATSERYADGKLLRSAFIHWANIAGLRSSYDPLEDTITFNPQHFSPASMEKAKLFSLPAMEEALSRSRRRRALQIKGTFNRIVAINREDLVFFAPGTDPWTDAIVANALEAYRGRSCAILRDAQALSQSWRGFELLYSLHVDPRPLYRAGLDPIHLFRAQGYLTTPVYRIVISVDGEVEKPGGVIYRLLASEFVKDRDKHLGQRDSKESLLHYFKEEHPPDLWVPLVARTREIAESILAEELDFMHEVAEDARTEFDKYSIGWRASHRWLLKGDFPSALEEIEEYDRASCALVEGIASPVTRLESVCYWHLRART